jgi:hypothetical protein
MFMRDRRQRVFVLTAPSPIGATMTGPWRRAGPDLVDRCPPPAISGQATTQTRLRLTRSLHAGPGRRNDDRRRPPASRFFPSMGFRKNSGNADRLRAARCPRNPRTRIRRPSPATSDRLSSAARLPHIHPRHANDESQHAWPQAAWSKTGARLCQKGARSRCSPSPPTETRSLPCLGEILHDQDAMPWAAPGAVATCRSDSGAVRESKLRIRR